MTDLDTELRDYARRWGGDADDLPALDDALRAVRTRRRRAWPVVVSAAACVLAVAVGLAIVSARRPHNAPIRDGAAAVPAAVRAALENTAATIAAESVVGPYTAQAVRTTLGDASRRFGLQALHSDRAVWLVGVRGDIQTINPTFAMRQGPAPIPGTPYDIVTSSLQFGSQLLTEVDNGGQVRGVPSVMTRVADLASVGPVVDLGRGTGSGPDYRALIATVRNVAVTNGDPTASAIAVRTTYREALSIMGSGSSTSSRPVLLVRLTGVFVCNSCSRPYGAKAPSGKYVTLILGVHPPYAVSDFGLTDKQPDFSRLHSTAARLLPTRP